MGGQGGEHHSPSLQEGSLEKNPMTSGLKWSQSNKRSGHQAREAEGPPRRGGKHTCSVANFQISPPRLWRREGITALERRISGAISPPSLQNSHPIPLPSSQLCPPSLEASQPSRSFAPNRPEMGSSIYQHLLDHRKCKRVPEKHLLLFH